jgi:hypothetical protein
MPSHRSEKRVPTWIKITVPVFLFVAAIFAGLVVIATRDLPECARAAAIEKRFEKQLAHLKELALAHGPDLPPPEAAVAEEESSGSESAEIRNAIHRFLPQEEMWWIGMEIDEELFADPVILDASIRYYRGRTENCMIFKGFDEPDGAWTLSFQSPTLEKPEVSFYQAGKKRWIRYENRFEGASGMQRGCRLCLDLDLLEKGWAPAFNENGQ